MNKVVEYYQNTADVYDDLHGDDSEHIVAMERGWPLVAALAGAAPASALEVGCGTGRSLAWIAERAPGARLSGIEPSEALLDRARTRLPEADLRAGFGEKLPFGDDAFDFVMATAVLHHVEDPDAVIREMFRVSRRFVLISDHNNFAFGSRRALFLRLGLYAARVLPFATYVKQGFNRQGYSEGDGWWYPYSLLNSFAEIIKNSEEYYIFPTRRPKPRKLPFFLTHSHVAVLSIKDPA